METLSAHQSEQEKKQFQWLALIACKGLGQQTLKKALNYFDTLDEIFEANPTELKQAGLSNSVVEQICKKSYIETVETNLRWTESESNHLITLDHPAYPEHLKSFYDPPWALFVKGDPEVLSTIQIAVVGSRNASQIGLQNAFEFSQYLASNGVSITSGLALGVDTQAHKGALNAAGITVAVVATGLDRVYPARNRDLAHQIIEEGAIVSENPLGTPPQAGLFPKRNRIISGLSRGTLIVEGTVNSGSLITARHAMEQGREVFAIPGSIHNPLAKGCHALIKQGAKLVENGADIFSELTSIFDLAPSQQEDINPTNPTELIDNDQKTILEHLEHDFISVDYLTGKTGIPVEKLSSTLLMLELNDLIISSPGGMYAINPKKEY